MPLVGGLPWFASHLGAGLLSHDSLHLQRLFKPTVVALRDLVPKRPDCASNGMPGWPATCLIACVAANSNKRQEWILSNSGNTSGCEDSGAGCIHRTTTCLMLA
jgi:hypothetical protein